MKMILTILNTSWIQFRRDRIAQFLTYLMPIVFFSIFAMVFGGSDGHNPMSNIKVVLVDEDNSAESERLIAWLKDEGSIRIISSRTVESENEDGVTVKTTVPLTREEAIGQVKSGDYPVGLIIPKGFADSLGFFGALGETEDSPAIQMYVDYADPIASNVVSGLLQAASMSALPDVFMSNGMDMFEQFAGPMTNTQQTAIDAWIPSLKSDSEQSLNQTDDVAASIEAAGSDEAESGSSDTSSAFAGLIPIDTHDVNAVHENEDGPKILAYYAAGTGVLFLLFSVVGAAQILLDYEEAGVLERMLSSRMSMGHLMVGHWIFITVMGTIQICTMFIWGNVAFGLDIWTAHHIGGLLIMATITGMAAASFGLVLAAVAKSRAQLQGMSTILILTMSAIGGSMFPRFMMPESMVFAGKFTFNAWAIEGFQKVFWYQSPLWQLWPQVSVLLGITLVFMFTARQLARKWEMT